MGILGTSELIVTLPFIKKDFLLKNPSKREIVKKNGKATIGKRGKILSEVANTTSIGDFQDKQLSGLKNIENQMIIFCIYQLFQVFYYMFMAISV